MSLRKLRFAIFGNIYQARKSADIQRLLLSLNERMAQVSMERSFYDFLCSSHGLPLHGVTVFEGNDFDADFVISMGGDGTLLCRWRAMVPTATSGFRNAPSTRLPY